MGSFFYLSDHFLICVWYLIYEQIGNLTVSEFYSSQHGKCHTWTVSPDDTLLDARRIMDLHGVSMLPVISRKTEDHKGGYLVGLLDSESIDIACR